MKQKILIAALVFCLMILAAEVGIVVYMETRPASQSQEATGEATQVPETTEVTEEIPTTVPATTGPEETEPAETEPAETEPGQIRYTLTFAGDCTLASDPGNYASPHGFIETIGTDYGYPFRNVLEYFTEDDCSFANLEGVLGDKGTRVTKKYNFRGDGAYTQILTQNSVDVVTLANNHSMDYGKEGYEETKRLLDEAKMHYVEDLTCLLKTTERGLEIALYAVDMSQGQDRAEQIVKDIRELKEAGYAELIVCAFHWGRENTFRPTEAQQELARAAIDAGANIIWGHHPHVLQPIEEYNGGIIYYSLGNFAFGGNSSPKDLNTALLQQEVIREADGTIRLGELTIVPCGVNSEGSTNNFQPTPYEPGSANYEKVLSKLDGSYKGGNLPIG